MCATSAAHLERSSTASPSAIISAPLMRRCESEIMKLLPAAWIHRLCSLCSYDGKGSRLVAAACDVWAVRGGKGGADFETERWALEFVPHGIRVNTVSPGSILVAGNGWDRYRLANQEYFDDYVRHGFPMDRLGTAEEVADVIVFLASPCAHWINGRNIPVDGLEQPHAPLDRRPY